MIFYGLGAQLGAHYSLGCQQIVMLLAHRSNSLVLN